MHVFTASSAGSAVVIVMSSLWEKSSNAFPHTVHRSDRLGRGHQSTPHSLRPVWEDYPCCCEDATGCRLSQEHRVDSQAACRCSGPGKWRPFQLMAANVPLSPCPSLAQGHSWTGEGSGLWTSGGTDCAGGEWIDTGTQDAGLEAMGETGGTNTGQAMGLATSTDHGTQSLVILTPRPNYTVN